MPSSGGLPARLRTPRAGGVAGIIFAVLLGVVIIFMRSGLVDIREGSGTWIDSSSGRASATIAVNLIPFAGIAFLWFIGAIRTNLGDSEDRLFATVFLGSGLLFVAMLFSTAAVVGSLLNLTSHGQSLDQDTQRLLAALAAQLLGAFGARMAAVFTLAVTTLGWRTRAIPPWLAVIGYAVPIVLFLTPPITQWAQLLFPLWVLLLSGHVLYVSYRVREPAEIPEGR